MNTIKYICFLLIYKVSCSSKIEMNELNEVLKEIDTNDKREPDISTTVDPHIQTVNSTDNQPIKEFTNISYSPDSKNKNKRVSPSKLIEEIIENKPNDTNHPEINRQVSKDSSEDIDAESIVVIEKIVQELEVLTERVFTPTKRKLTTHTNIDKRKKRRLNFDD